MNIAISVIHQKLLAQVELYFQKFWASIIKTMKAEEKLGRKLMELKISLEKIGEI
jgi:hypothetical protein